jgi:nucleoside-diphosphate-sugar epimerase
VNNTTCQRIGITGGTGFIGRRFAQMAAARGYQVRCLVRSNSTFDSSMENVEVVKGDITDPASLREFVQGLDAVIHLAAYVGHGTDADYRKVNVIGSQNVCEAILQYQPDCTLMYCSSVAVLRRYQRLRWFNTRYTTSKAVAEELVRRYESERDLKVNYVYPGLVYGPEDDKFIPTLLKYIKQEKLINVSGGESSAPLVFIDDLCNLMLYMLSNPNSIGRGYIGVGKQEVGIHEFFRMLARRVNSKEKMITLPKHLLMPLALLFEWSYRLLGKEKMPPLSRRVVDVLSINFDPKVVKQFNQDEWCANTSLESGLDLTFSWLRKTGLA